MFIRAMVRIFSFGERWKVLINSVKLDLFNSCQTFIIAVEIVFLNVLEGKVAKAKHLYFNRLLSFLGYLETSKDRPCKTEF